MVQTDPILAWSSSRLKASRKFLSSARCQSQKPQSSGTSARQFSCRRKIGVHELQPPKLGPPQKSGGKYPENQSWNWSSAEFSMCLVCVRIYPATCRHCCLGCLGFWGARGVLWHCRVAQVAPGPPSTCCRLWPRGPEGSARQGPAGGQPAWLGSRCWAGRRRLHASAVSHRAASPAVCPGGAPGSPSRDAADGLWGFPCTGQRLRDPRTARP